MPITKEQLADWKATTAAIHGPWHAEAYQDGMEPQYLKDADGDHVVSTQEDYEIDPTDLAFMAVASEAMPVLLAEVEQLQDENNTQADLLNYLGPYINWQQIGAAAVLSEDERARFGKLLAPIFRKET